MKITPQQARDAASAMRTGKTKKARKEAALVLKQWQAANRLTDKNGVEIFESDWIRTGISTGDSSKDGERWSLDGFVVWLDGALWIENPKKPEARVLLCYAANNPLYVTGNVYENPELSE